jgi:hypothetical protein
MRIPDQCVKDKGLGLRVMDGRVKVWRRVLVAKRFWLDGWVGEGGGSMMLLVEGLCDLKWVLNCKRLLMC